MTYDEEVFWHVFPTWLLLCVTLGLFFGSFNRKVVLFVAYGAVVACVTAFMGIHGLSYWTWFWSTAGHGITDSHDVTLVRQIADVVYAVLTIGVYVGAWYLVRLLPGFTRAAIKLTRVGYIRLYKVDREARQNSDWKQL